MVFIKKLRKMLKQLLTLPILSWKGKLPKKDRKGYWLNEGQITRENND